jgi:hypothetical protein
MRTPASPFVHRAQRWGLQYSERSIFATGFDESFGARQGAWPANRFSANVQGSALTSDLPSRTVDFGGSPVLRQPKFRGPAHKNTVI